jgi:hypothetical protein
MPDLKWAVTALLARNLLSQLDVPTRQPYTMAIVHPDERAASAGVLSVARNVGASVAPLFNASVLADPAVGLPFLLAGGLKIVYDLWILAVFQKGASTGRRALASLRIVGFYPLTSRGSDTLKTIVRL